MADDRLYEAMIKRALKLAHKGDGYTSPNPVVGAVVFNRDGVIATGYHKRAGMPHAEREALNKAGDRARGASLAVNLEPCCHHGRTGPCTEAIIAAGIKEVVYSVEDPNPEVSCKGAGMLIDNGINVISGVGREEALRINEVYFKYMTTGRPFVVLKMAQSLDGRLATVGGDSKWISCPAALKFAHKLRALYDAAAVGAGTVRADDPSLTVRQVKGIDPYRIVITSSKDLSPSLNLFKNNEDKKTVVATSRQVIASQSYKDVSTWPIKKAGNHLDLEDVLIQAGRHEVTSVLVEGGGKLATELLRRRLVDKFYLVIAPRVIGRGIDAVGDLNTKKISQAITFKESGFRKMDIDTLFWGYPEN